MSFVWKRRCREAIDQGTRGILTLSEVRAPVFGGGYRETGQVNAIVVGGGLAGCEAAWVLAESGVPVTLFEMRPQRTSAAHETDLLAEVGSAATIPLLIPVMR